MSILDRVKRSWNVFKARDKEPPASRHNFDVGPGYSYRPDKKRYMGSAGREITNSIYNRIGVDFADVDIKHIKEDKNNRYLKDVDSGLNRCLTLSANPDQGGRNFRQDIAMTMLEEGVVAVVPIDTDNDPDGNTTFDIQTMRVGTITAWYPDKVTVRVFRQETGQFEELTMPKSVVAIIENPFYSIMNEPNSTLQRLIHKLSQLDVTDDRLAAGKLDIILQLPYTIKHESRLREANKRIGDIETQLTGSKHGIGYIDSTERVTQLNRPSENNLLQQVERLEQRVYDQMGLTTEVFTGTADEASMLNYHNRTVFPIVRAIQEEFHRKFLTKTAISQGQAIQYFRDPFSLVPVSQIAEIADKFTRNEIMAPNEFRPVVGLRPVKDPEADELRNRNMPKVDPAPEGKTDPPSKESPETKEDGTVQELLRTISRREETR